MLPAIGQTMKVSFADAINADEYQIIAIGYDDFKLVTTVPSKLTDIQTKLDETNDVILKYRAPDGALLSFTGSVVRISLDPPQLELRLPSDDEITREQRREFVRVSVGLPVRVETMSQSRPKHFDLHMRDISGGGMAVLLPPTVVIPVGTDLRTRFTLPRGDVHIDVKCSVVRLSERNEYNFAVCSLRFFDMKDSIRQKIVQYTFIRQRELAILKKDMSPR